MDNLPINISLNIFSRLPIFSLFHCKLVSKTWRDLAYNPLLPRLHFLHHQESQNNNLSLILHSSASTLPPQDNLYLLENCAKLDDEDAAHHHHHHHHHHHDYTTLKKIKIPFKHNRFSCVLNCNGLLFLSHQQGRVDLVAADEICVVYNPFIKQVINIPNRDIVIKGDSVYGFGFHSRTRDYKVVRIVENETASVKNYNLNEFELSLDQRIEVFTLGTDIFWREKRFNNRFLLRMQPSEALINGALHWFGQAKFSHAQIIVAFDLGDEEFRQISNPSCTFHESNSSLVALGGCLSVVVHYEEQMEIWVMKKYGEKESWIKQFTIGMDFSEYGCFIRPLCLLKNGNILMEYLSREMLCYDPNSESFFKTVNIDKLPTLFRAVPHV